MMIIVIIVDIDVLFMMNLINSVYFYGSFLLFSINMKVIETKKTLNYDILRTQANHFRNFNFQNIPSFLIKYRIDTITNLKIDMSIKCGVDDSCPLLYQCIKKTLTCHHKPIFPITGYQYGIFSLFPICSAICNLSGNSWGQFKVLMLMDLLNYQQNQATTLAYPLITGTALYNFFDLIPKRHPSKNTSLIDFNVVLIIIPNILFGSTIGSLVNKFIPPIVADSLIIPIMIGFSIKFWMRYRALKKDQEKDSSEAKDGEREETKKQIQVQLIQVQQKQKQKGIQNKNDLGDVKKQGRSKQDEIQTKQVPVTIKIIQNKGQSPSNNQPLQYQFALAIPKSPTEQYKSELLEHQKYQSGLHLPHVLATITIFIVFQTLSFLVQGKIIPFSICTTIYPIGLSVLACLFLFFDYLVFRYTRHRLQYYDRIGYEYGNQKIMQPKYYLMVCFGAFLGGFNSGTFGIGNSTTVIFTLLTLGMEPMVASATVGYQVVFAGSASLAQAFATNSIQGNVALLFFLQTFILGGILSFIAKRIVYKFNRVKVNKCLMLTVFCLVTCSVFALIASVVLGYVQFGAANMQDVPFHC